MSGDQQSLQQTQQVAENRWAGDQVRGMITEMTRLRRHMLETEAHFARELERLHPRHRARARNLLHYVALRRHDIRPLQESLVRHGLSSLGRCEPQVMRNLDAVLDILLTLTGGSRGSAVTDSGFAGFPADSEPSDELTQELFGAKPTGRNSYIMVTMPSTAADDYGLVKQLLSSGMNCMRINCAHDDEQVWSKIVRNARRAEAELQRPCRVIMDLAGPKLRTATKEDGPRVAKWRPDRDDYGRVTAAARIGLYPSGEIGEFPSDVQVRLPVIGDVFGRLDVGDKLRLRDARGRLRLLSIVSKCGNAYIAESHRTGYVVPGTELRYVATGPGEFVSGQVISQVGALVSLGHSILLRKGDLLILEDGEGSAAATGAGHCEGTAQIPRFGCTLPSIFCSLRCGDAILFDDGRIGGRVREVHADHLLVEITAASVYGERLRGDKGINFPGSQLDLCALTDKDVQDLQFVVQHADAVAYSFVRRTEDVLRLQTELARLGHPDFRVILKIENRQAVQQLPRLLLAAMRSGVAGIMIARGDLAVECGWQRLAELQEEILWICEAAHLPVIWATQVLEGLAKTGMPSRAEVTDAAMAVRAECVMLNKGPHIVQAVVMLDDILRRMQDHQAKKRTLMRRLRLADDLFEDNQP